MRINQAVILIGGKEARLGALAPNPMLEVGGRPFVEHTIAHLARYGVRQVILLAGHAGLLPRERYHGRTMFGADVSVLAAPEPLGTGGALVFARDDLDGQFLLTSGDTFFDADLLPLLRVASDPRWSAAMLLRRTKAAAHDGVALDANGIVRGFHEQSAAPSHHGALADAGIYVMRRERVLADIGKPPCSLEDVLLAKLAAEGALAGVVADGYFVDTAIPDSLDAARSEMTRRRTRPAAFLDRDGVLNIDKGYTHKPSDLAFVPGAVAAVKMLNAAGYYVLVITNQSGVARGFYPEQAVRQFHLHMQNALMEQGAHIDAFYYCPHHPEGTVAALAVTCDCRKPATGMLAQAAADWPIDLKRSVLVGDKDDDMAAAKAFNIQGVRFDARSGPLNDAIAAYLASVRR